MTTIEDTLIDKLSLELLRRGLNLTQNTRGAIIGVEIYEHSTTLPSVQINAISEIISAGMVWERIRQFVLGDLVNLGFQLKGEDFAQLLPADKTLANWSSICAQYDHSQRIHNLSFSHYAAVAYVKDKRARANLLAQAEVKNWSVKELEAARNLDAGNPTPDIDYNFTVFAGVSTAIKLWNSGTIDRAQYDQLVKEYGRGELSVEIKVLGRK